MACSALPLLIVNQSIGSMFADVIAAAERYGPVVVFRGCKYRRETTRARLLTWLVFTIQLVWHLLWHGRRYSRLLVVSNPPFAPLVAPFARRPYSLLLYDLYPQILAQLQPSHPLQRCFLHLLAWLWNAINRKVFTSAECVFTLSADMAERLRPCFSTEESWRNRVHIILPWADTSQIQPSPAAAQIFRRNKGVEGLLITYSGNLGITHPLESLLEASSLLEDLPVSPPVQVFLVGDGPKRNSLEQLALSLRLPASRLRFFDLLPSSELAASLSAADLAVVALDGPASGASLPSKTFNALACGTPLLVLAPISSTLGKLVQQHRCGLIIEPGPEAAQQLCDAIIHLVAHPAELRQLGANALAASEIYRPVNAQRLLEILLGPPLEPALKSKAPVDCSDSS
jgi:colanic acid biosynthesis glycosyl transferase WcaI